MLRCDVCHGDLHGIGFRKCVRAHNTVVLCACVCLCVPTCVRTCIRANIDTSTSPIRPRTRAHAPETTYIRTCIRHDLD